MARLKAANARNAWNPNETLVRYATEGFLRRLGKTPHRRALTLKGGNMFIVWMGGFGHRPTIDTDILCRGDASPEHLLEMFRDIASVDCSEEDGLVFDPDSLSIAPSAPARHTAVRSFRSASASDASASSFVSTWASGMQSGRLPGRKRFPSCSVPPRRASAWFRRRRPSPKNSTR